MRPTTVNSVGNWIRTLTVVVLAGTALPAAAQSLPVARLFSVYPPGARQGASLDVTIAGVDLDGVSQLHFSTPGITATQKTVPPGLGETTPQPAPGQFTIQVAADAKPGICEVRAIGKYGVSNPRSFVIGTHADANFENGLTAGL